eukprot:9093209-Pyramimonas_sp.AAC.1
MLCAVTMTHSMVLPLAPFGFPRHRLPLPDARPRFLPAPRNISSYWGPGRDARNASMPLPCGRRRIPLPLLRPLPFPLSVRRAMRLAPLTGFFVNLRQRRLCY